MFRTLSLSVFFLSAACAVPGAGDLNIGHTEAAIVVETPLWTSNPSDIADARFGSALAGSLDINGDGYDDAVVTAPLWSSDVNAEGRVYVYFGSARGLPTAPSWYSDPTNTVDAGFSSIAGLGDVNGDGFGDFAVLADRLGMIYLYLGSATGPSETPMTRSSPGASTIAGAGDINGDGFADLIVGLPSFGTQQAQEGRAVIILGAADGLSGQSYPLDPTNQAGANFGIAVASAGDVNGDGFGDVVIGASGWNGQVVDEGRAYVYFGSADGPTLGWMLDPTNQEQSFFGASVSGAGDINGDGFSELIVGAPNWSDTVARRGKVYIFKGGTDTPPPPLTLSPIDQEDANFGNSVSGAGDVNGDGYSDIVVGSATFDANVQTVDSGQMLLYLGSSLGLDTEIGGTSAPGAAAGSRYGSVVATAGDVNGDGLSDVIASAPRADGGVVGEGVVYGFYGAAPLGAPDLLLVRDRQLRQATGNGTELPLGATTANTSVDLAAILIQERPLGGLLRMEFELKTSSVPFDGLNLQTSDAASAGSIATTTYSDLATGQYKWRARTIYPVGSGRGAWMNYSTPAAGGDPQAAVPDFAIEDPPPPDVEVREKVGYYDCRISHSPKHSSKGAMLLVLLLPVLLVLRRRKNK